MARSLVHSQKAWVATDLQVVDLVPGPSWAFLTAEPGVCSASVATHHRMCSLESGHRPTWRPVLPQGSQLSLSSSMCPCCPLHAILSSPHLSCQLQAPDTASLRLASRMHHGVRSCP